jgi:hypothetical protein
LRRCRKARAGASRDAFLWRAVVCSAWNGLLTGADALKNEKYRARSIDYCDVSAQRCEAHPDWLSGGFGTT